MNKFSADFSSSPPSTPGAVNEQPFRKPLFTFNDDPSTTPAGPPPSSAASFTPAGPPPSSVFGSSRLGSGVSKLQFDVQKPSKLFQQPDELPPRTKNGTPARPRNNNKFFGETNMSGFTRPLQSFAEDEDGEEEIEERTPHGEEIVEGMENEIEDEDEPGSPGFTGFTSVNPSYVQRPPPTRALARRSLQPDGRQQHHRQAYSNLSRKGDPNVVPELVREATNGSQTASLTETDDVVVHTEMSMRMLSEEIQTTTSASSAQRAATRCAHELIGIWRSAVRAPDLGRGEHLDPSGLTTPFAKANYLASLLLALYHPPSLLDLDAPGQSSRSLAVASKSNAVPLPRILLDWLDTFHTSYHPILEAVLATESNPTAHPLYWDIVQSLVLRAKLREVIKLFAVSDFKYAASATDDGSESPGYSGAQLQAAQGVTHRAQQLLDSCPGSRSADWNVDDAEWSSYRLRVSTELDSLTMALNGNLGDEEGSFEAENFGMKRSDRRYLSRSLRNATASLPVTVYENLRTIYRIILGSSEDIMAQSQDWLEATTALTIWWDGIEGDSVTAWTLDVSQAYGSIVAQNPFLPRLRSALLFATDPEMTEAFPIDNTSLTDLGVAAIFQGDLEGALLVTQTMSLSLTSALAELGTIAGWLSTKNKGIPPGLNQEDLMVLSYGADSHELTEDNVLAKYAEALFEKDYWHQPDGSYVEGWEVALSVASRLTDEALSKTMIGDFIDGLELQNQEKMDRLVSICGALGLEEEGRKVSQKFADHLITSASSYGLALVYYARSHSTSRVRQVVDLLNSYCLVQSKSYPDEADMDEHLKAMIESPRTAFQSLNGVDSEAAEMLKFYFAGYACLRKFYKLRDKDTGFSHKPIARKRLSAKTLVAAINSAADSIYGGLYDSQRQSAIQVDGLLSLLGEATALLAANNEASSFTVDQMYALLAAIEDLQTVSSRVYDATEECLQATLKHFHGSLPPSPRAMLKKSVSSGTTSNFNFSMMGSEMLARSGESSGGKSVGSVVLVAGETGSSGRGWDWRDQFKEKSTTGADVLRYLRIHIAKDLALAELQKI